MKPSVLLIEDNDAARFGFVRYFAKEGYEICEAADLAEAAAKLSARRFDAIVMDVNLPDGNGIDFIDTIRESDPNIPIIVITGAGNIQLAVQAMQRGADNFLTKPVDNSALSEYLRKTLEIGALKRQVTARKRLEKQEETFFGDSPAMHEILNLAEIASSGDNPVLFTGETGTGKGMLSKWIHRHNARSKNEFVEVNCSGLRGELLAREIFGNARGAYTSADQDRKGLLDIADQGTRSSDLDQQRHGCAPHQLVGDGPQEEAHRSAMPMCGKRDDVHALPLGELGDAAHRIRRDLHRRGHRQAAYTQPVRHLVQVARGLQLAVRHGIALRHRSHAGHRQPDGREALHDAHHRQLAAERLGQLHRRLDHRLCMRRTVEQQQDLPERRRARRGARRLRTQQQQRLLELPHEPVGHAAEPEAAEDAPAVRGHHHEVHCVVVRVARDGVGDGTLDDLRHDLQRVAARHACLHHREVAALLAP